MAKVIIPTPLRKFTENRSIFETTGATVGEAIQELTSAYSGLGKHLLDDQQQLRSFIRVYLGEQDINALQREMTAVQPDSVISIVPAIAGGAHA